MRNEIPKVDSISQVKLRAFPVLVSILLSITTYMVIEVRSDVKALLTGKAQADQKINRLEIDVERLNNKVFFDPNSNKEEPNSNGKPFSSIVFPSVPPSDESFPKTNDFFIAPAPIQYEKRKYIAYKGKT